MVVEVDVWSKYEKTLGERDMKEVITPYTVDLYKYEDEEEWTFGGVDNLDRIKAEKEALKALQGANKNN